jgi:hypothetical protein
MGYFEMPAFGNTNAAAMSRDEEDPAGVWVTRLRASNLILDNSHNAIMVKMTTL